MGQKRRYGLIAGIWDSRGQPLLYALPVQDETEWGFYPACHSLKVKEEDIPDKR